MSVRRRCGVLIVTGASLVGLSATADAHRSLSPSERRAIVATVNVPAPDGGRIRDASCIAGQLSTVNRRWAAFHLSNTTSCARRYGGASGESALVKRASTTSRRWTRRGSIGDNCRRGTGGASAAVLRDLGCALSIRAVSGRGLA
jgi:hypothetical protein